LTTSSPGSGCSSGFHSHNAIKRPPPTESEASPKSCTSRDDARPGVETNASLLADLERNISMAKPHCRHKHSAPRAALQGLHEAQRPTSGRHRCAGVAYDMGFEWGMRHSHLEGLDSAECQKGLRAPISMIEALPVCQGGPGRHKCVVCAYHRGFEDARPSSRPG
jgi:hypothetical protein